MLPFYDALEKKIKKSKEQSGFGLAPWPLFFAGLAMLFAILVVAPSIILPALSLAFFLLPLWLPLALVGTAWEIWVDLKRSEFIASQEYILLEIKPPRMIEKTPLAMEAVLSGLHLSPGEGTWYKKYIKGAVRPWWSFEIASLEGQVHFFVWTRAGYRRIIETQIYAQYSGAQVVEVQDYTRMINADPGEWEIWGCDFTESKAGPYPIRTYVDYGLDKVAKEPEQVDPLSNLIEFMGSMGKGEYLWLQLPIRVHKGEKYKKLNKEGKSYTWKDEAKEVVEELRKKTVTKFKDPATGVSMEGFPNPTKGQMETIAAIERNVSKLPFDVGARGVYISRPESFSPTTIAGLTGIFKQFSSEEWNGFKPARWMTAFNDYPWEFNVDHRKNKTRKALIEAYRRRSFFYQPFKGEYMTMSTEELATIYHIPSGATETPGFQRIQSSTSDAPVNLPT
ncbi:MAG: hypothetical protein WDN10_00495 [bacterium]